MKLDACELEFVRNLLDYASIAVSVKYATKYLLSSVKSLALEKIMKFVKWKKQFIFYESTAD